MALRDTFPAVWEFLPPANPPISCPTSTTLSQTVAVFHRKTNHAALIRGRCCDLDTTKAAAGNEKGRPIGRPREMDRGAKDGSHPSKIAASAKPKEVPCRVIERPRSRGPFDLTRHRITSFRLLNPALLLAWFAPSAKPCRMARAWICSTVAAEQSLNNSCAHGATFGLEPRPSIAIVAASEMRGHPSRWYLL